MAGRRTSTLLDCQDAKALELALEAGQAGKIALEHTTQRLVEMGASPPRIPWGDSSQQQQSSSDQSRGDLSQLDCSAATPTTLMPPDESVLADQPRAVSFSVL